MFMQDIRQFEAAVPVPGLSRPQAGLPGATLVETATGWRPAAALCPGDRIATWDGGYRPLVAVRARQIRPEGLTMIRVPGGALNNCAQVWLRPDQQVLIRSPFVGAVLEAEAVLLPAAALAGFRGIDCGAPEAPLTLVALQFASDEVIFAATGLALLCPAEAAAAPGGPRDSGYHPRLDAARGRDLMALIAGGAMTSDGRRCVA